MYFKDWKEKIHGSEVSFAWPKGEITLSPYHPHGKYFHLSSFISCEYRLFHHFLPHTIFQSHTQIKRLVSFFNHYLQGPSPSSSELSSDMKRLLQLTEEDDDASSSLAACLGKVGDEQCMRSTQSYCQNPEEVDSLLIHFIVKIMMLLFWEFYLLESC